MKPYGSKTGANEWNHADTALEPVVKGRNLEKRRAEEEIAEQVAEPSTKSSCRNVDCLGACERCVPGARVEELEAMVRCSDPACPSNDPTNETADWDACEKCCPYPCCREGK